MKTHVDFINRKWTEQKESKGMKEKRDQRISAGEEGNARAPSQVFQYGSQFMCHGGASNVDVAFNSFAQVQKKTIRKPKRNNTQSLSISRGKTRGFTAQGSVNKRLNQIELQKMKGKHEWGNEGADVVSDQITISTDYWRGKRLIELFYHTESFHLSPHPKPIPLRLVLARGEATCVGEICHDRTAAERVAVTFQTYFNPFLLCSAFFMCCYHTDLW